MEAARIPIRFVFFDLDDTLIDTTAAVKASYDAAVARLRAEVGAAGFTAPGAEMERKLLSVFGSTLAPEFFLAWLYEAGVGDGLRQKLRGEVTAIFREHMATVPAYPEARAALEDLAAAGVGRGVITDGRVERQTEKLERSGLAPLVGPVFISGNYPPFCGKPAQAMFVDALAAAAVPAAAVMFVGDRVHDVIGANLAGMVSTRLRRGWAKDEEPPEGVAAARACYTIYSLRELPDVIRRHARGA